MRIAVAADERVGIAEAVVEELRKRGHEPIAHGALSESERDDWAWASEAAARCGGGGGGAGGRGGGGGGGGAGAGGGGGGTAAGGFVCGGGGRGPPPPAKKAAGPPPAFSLPPRPAGGPRRWNDANVLALS